MNDRRSFFPFRLGVTDQIGDAASTHGINWTKFAAPVLAATPGNGRRQAGWPRTRPCPPSDPSSVVRGGRTPPGPRSGRRRASGERHDFRGLSEDLADLLQKPQAQPPPERSVNRRVVAVSSGNVPPPAAGALAVEDSVEGAARIDPRAAGGGGRIQMMEGALHRSPRVFRDLPPPFRGAFGRDGAP